MALSRVLWWDSGIGLRALCTALLMLMATGSAVHPAQADVAITSCEEAGFSFTGRRELWECRVGSGQITPPGSDDQLLVRFASARGLDMSSTAMFLLVRVAIDGNTDISDIAIADFAKDYLFEGNPDVKPEERFAAFELATATHPIAGETPSHCFVFLRQWGAGNGASHNRRFGGYYCGIIAMPERKDIETFLLTIRYEPE